MSYLKQVWRFLELMKNKFVRENVGFNSKQISIQVELSMKKRKTLSFAKGRQ